MRTVQEHIASFREQADHLADAAEMAGLPTPTPTCPDWTVRHVLAHAGGVHAWAAQVVSQGLANLPDTPDLHEAVAEIPDHDLPDWYRAQAENLADVLADAPDDLQCAAFLPAPSPRAFWARRQAHECAIHRADVESALGRIPLYDAAHARDGIDELLLRFLARKRQRPAFAQPRTMLVRATEGGIWHLTLGPETVTGVEATEASEAEPADVTIVGPASDVYLWAWNRVRPGEDTVSLMVDGDSSVLESWRDNIWVRWS